MVYGKSDKALVYSLWFQEHIAMILNMSPADLAIFVMYT